MNNEFNSNDQFTVLDLAMLNNYTMYMANQESPDLVVPISKMTARIDAKAIGMLGMSNANDGEMALYASSPDILNGKYGILVYSGHNNHRLVTISELLRFIDIYMDPIAVVLGVIDRVGARYYAWESDNKISRAFFDTNGNELELKNASSDPNTSGIIPTDSDYQYYPIIIQSKED